MFADKECCICGETFTPRSNTQKMCDKEHYHPCPICGTQVLTKSPSETNKCCSRKCSLKLAHKSRVNTTRICEMCGKEFKPTSMRQKYCTGTHSKNCEVCGKSFEIDVHAASIPSCCSEKCKNEKRKQTYIQHFGEDNPAKVKEFRDKARKTTLERYGVEYYIQSEEGKSRYLDTMQSRYGAPYPMQSDYLKEKHQQSCLLRYGHRTPLTLPQDRIANIQYYSNPENLQSAAQKRSETYSKIVASDGTHLDSQYELQVYEFCLRNNLDVERQVPITYTYEESEHTTFIDFRIDGILFECKGSHLLTGTYDGAKYLVPIEVKLDVYRHNNVIVITDSDAKSIFGKPNSAESNGLKYQKRCPNPLIGVDLALFGNEPEFPFRADRPELFYKVKVDGQKSSYDAFYDESVRWKMILNRINYSGGFIDNNQILTALNVTRTCKQPSWFSKSFAKGVLKKYATQHVIVDPFAGWGTRCDASAELNLEYVGGDYNEELVAWHNQRGRSSIQFKDAREFKYEDPCTVLICPPYSDPKTGRCFEDYNFEGFDESAKTLSQCDWLKIVMENIPNAAEYIMVCKIVDEGFEDYIVDTKSNRSHFGTNTEYILVVKN